MAKDNPSKPTLDVGVHVIKADPELTAQDAGVLQSNVREIEDEFVGLYELSTSNVHARLIEPPISMANLEFREQQSNALGPCVDAMEVNIDGTGHVIERADGEEMTDADKAQAESINDFFNEPWPGESFITLRRKLRRDLERTGNAYIEVLRNAKGDLVFCRHVEGKTVRLVRLDAPAAVEKEIKRGGKKFKIKVFLRERRYAQKIAAKLIYFKDFKATRELDKISGEWAKKGEAISFQRKATELIHFTVKRDVGTPYGLPRWINQVPSVLGSRKAEEHNLQFFDRGGIPPLLVLVAGGTIAPASRDALNDVLNSKDANKHQAAVIEVYSASTSLDKDSPVRITVERFGAERQKDSMFENYDKRSFERIRTAFRLPPLFLGKAEDYSFATAFVSYTVAEAQVFTPERMEFDEIINLLFMPELDPEGKFVFRSLPLSMNDVQNQLKALELVKDKISGESLIESVNEVTGMEVKFDEDTANTTAEREEAEFNQRMLPPPPAQLPPPGKPGKPATPPAQQTQPATAPTAKMEAEDTLIDLANRALVMIGKGEAARDPKEWELLMGEIRGLTKGESEALQVLVASGAYLDTSLDLDGAAEMAGCAMAVIAANADNKEQTTH